MATGRVKFGLSQPFDSRSASTINKYNVLLDTIIHRIHKWPPRGTVWTQAHENEVGKASLMFTSRAGRRGELFSSAII